MNTDENVVRKITGRAREAATATGEPADRAQGARNALLSLPGCSTGDALASAIICAAHPTDMAIYDRRAHAALTALGIKLTNTGGCYGRYIGIISALRERAHLETGAKWTARDVDLALYMGG